MEMFEVSVKRPSEIGAKYTRNQLIHVMMLDWSYAPHLVTEILQKLDAGQTYDTGTAVICKA